MSKERWIEKRVTENGKATVLYVEELDGWAFMRAQGRGEAVREERILDLTNASDRALYDRYNRMEI